MFDINKPCCTCHGLVYGGLIVVNSNLMEEVKSLRVLTIVTDSFEFPTGVIGSKLYLIQQNHVFTSLSLSVRQ